MRHTTVSCYGGFGRALYGASVLFALAGAPSHGQEAREAPGIPVPISPAHPTRPATAVLAYQPMVTHTWALLYREFRTEFLGCLYGVVRSGGVGGPDSLVVSFMLLADVKPSQSTDQSVGETSSCPASRGLLGLVHSHPGGRPCGRSGAAGCAPVADQWRADLCLPSRTDSTSFARSAYLIDVIVCGDGQVVAITRDFAVTRCQYDPEADQPTCLNQPPGTLPPVGRDEVMSLP